MKPLFNFEVSNAPPRPRWQRNLDFVFGWTCAFIVVLGEYFRFKQ